MSFCQDLTTKKVKISTLKKIKKEFDKCDSLKVRYQEKKIAFDDLYLANKNSLMQLKNEKEKSDIYQQKIKEINEQLKKSNKKSLKWIGGGLIGGAVITALILK